MSIALVDAGARLVLVRLSYLVLISLVSCARADPPEAFVADPELKDDYIDSFPSSGSSLGFDYEIIQGQAILEGDILLGMVDFEGRLINRLQARGVGKSDAFNRWPDGIVPYISPVNSSAIQQESVEKAIEHWMENTTLTFVEVTDENRNEYSEFIQFIDSRSCASYVGMIGGPQSIFISDACSVGSVIHEIGHAVGLFHEHTRPDRDNFVQIDWNEIVDGKDINFNRQTANVANYSEYDYGSIMHYGDKFFSRTGRPTIIVPEGISVGQREGLSPLDIQSVNAMYETDLSLGTPDTVETAAGLEINLTTYNIGSLGAHQIQLLLQLGDDSEWKGVSRDSGWDCLNYGSELKCTRDTLREQSESRFTVLADRNSASIDDLRIRLLSRTQDSNPENNAFNDAENAWESIDIDLTSAEDEGSSSESIDSINESETLSSPPPLSAANESQARDDDAVAQAAAGQLGSGILVLLASILGLRRRVSRRRI